MFFSVKHIVSTLVQLLLRALDCVVKPYIYVRKLVSAVIMPFVHEPYSTRNEPKGKGRVIVVG